ncbi:MAG: HEAT repeat domain-containing protein [Planctomycetes bacterium]|nr:HEAT repeat domain-containing protein [Planctomycetota bacterium]
MPSNDQRLTARLRALENDPTLPELEKTLSEALASVNNRLVGRAAAIVGQHQLECFIDDLRTAYERFLENPLKTDRGCEAKIPLCEALRQLEYDDADFFLEGIHYRQHEPAYNDQRYVDTAAELRAICGFALTQLNDSRAMSELVDLLGDPEKTARAGAARAIAHARGQASELLLRLKIDLGDSKPEVLGECFAGLLRIDPRGGIERIARFLEHPNEDVCCEAALALGESRTEAAFAPLRQQADRRHGRDFENVLLTSIGLLGISQSVDYLLQVVTGPDVGAAIAAVRALRHCRDPRSFGQRLLKAVAQTGNRQIDQVCAEEFPEMTTL